MCAARTRVVLLACCSARVSSWQVASIVKWRTERKQKQGFLTLSTVFPCASLQVALLFFQEQKMTDHKEEKEIVAEPSTPERANTDSGGHRHASMPGPHSNQCVVSLDRHMRHQDADRINLNSTATDIICVFHAYAASQSPEHMPVDEANQAFAVPRTCACTHTRTHVYAHTHPKLCAWDTCSSLQASCLDVCPKSCVDFSKIRHSTARLAHVSARDMHARARTRVPTVMHL